MSLAPFLKLAEARKTGTIAKVGQVCTTIYSVANTSYSLNMLTIRSSKTVMASLEFFSIGLRVIEQGCQISSRMYLMFDAIADLYEWAINTQGYNALAP